MIKLAAIRKDGVIYTGTRHCYIMHHPDRPLGFLKDGEQGFVTDTGEFVDRAEGAKIAFECGQIEIDKKKLYSEECIEVDENEKQIYNQFVSNRRELIISETNYKKLKICIAELLHFADKLPNIPTDILNVNVNYRAWLLNEWINNPDEEIDFDETDPFGLVKIVEV